MEAFGVQAASQLHHAIRELDIRQVRVIWAALGSPHLGKLDASLLEWWSRKTCAEQAELRQSYQWDGPQGNPTSCMDTLVNACKMCSDYPKRVHSTLILFLQERGSRVTMESLEYINSIRDLSYLASKELSLNGLNLTDMRSVLCYDCCGMGSPSWSCDFTAMLSAEWAWGEPGASKELLGVLHPLVAAGMRIFPFDRLASGPPARPPARPPASKAQRDVIRILWPGQSTREEDDVDTDDEDREGLLPRWPAYELARFRCRLAHMHADECWKRRRHVVWGCFRGNAATATGVGKLLLDLRAHAQPLTGQVLGLQRTIIEFIY